MGLMGGPIETYLERRETVGFRKGEARDEYAGKVEGKLEYLRHVFYFYITAPLGRLCHLLRDGGPSPVFGDEPPSPFKVPHCVDSRTLLPSRYSPSAPSPNASTTSITATAATGIRPLTGQPSKPRLTTVVIGHERYPAEVGRPRGRTVDALSLLQAVQDITWSAAGDWLRVTKTTSVHWRTQQLSGIGRGANEPSPRTFGYHIA